jgi:hypothetical protein
MLDQLQDILTNMDLARPADLRDSAALAVPGLAPCAAPRPAPSTGSGPGRSTMAPMQGGLKPLRKAP